MYVALHAAHGESLSRAIAARDAALRQHINAKGTDVLKNGRFFVRELDPKEKGRTRTARPAFLEEAQGRPN
jgi:hypothetical protein